MPADYGINGGPTGWRTGRSIELPGAGDYPDRGGRNLPVLFARAGADADGADDAVVDDDRQPARQVDALAVGRDRELDVDAGQDVACRLAVRRCRLGLHQ